MSKRLLIVDDQYGIRILLREVFAKEGFETYVAETGEEALNIVQNEKPDLVLLDVKIPGMDGLDILKHIKDYDKNIKVMMMTAYGELNLMSEAVKEGAIAYFLKPFDINEIRTSVKKELC
ncbi:response regulator [Pueribacillus sp. YX66]|uniref:response regulator n=1 Tax=Pueribacillus sp. YX66 TaxID=3229242 RepID=UPI00358D9A56